MHLSSVIPSNDTRESVFGHRNFSRRERESNLGPLAPEASAKLQINQIEKVQRTAARWTCRRWRNTSSVGEMLDELDWPSLEARRDQSSLLLFHKIHCGAVSIEKDKYMTPAHSSKTTRSSHSAQYRRHQTYSDALKNSFFPRTIPHWNSLPPSVANAQSTEEFRALLI